MRQAFAESEGVFDQYRRFRYQQYDRFSQWAQGHETTLRFGSAFALALVMGALAQVRLYTPLTPVPFTMQVFGASLMGGLLGRKWGTASAGMYVALGLVGLPVYAGQMAEFRSFAAFSGFVLFTTKLSAWYIVGFVAQAFIVGHVVDMRNRHRSTNLVVLAPVAVALLTTLALLQVYVLANYGTFYPDAERFPNVWFALAAGGVVVIAAGSLWLAMTTRARRERIELFAGNLVGLLALYVIGGVGFYFVWTYALQYPTLTVESFLAYTVLPFVPVDIAKILLAIGLITLVRPTRRELEGDTPTVREATSTDV